MPITFALDLLEKQKKAIESAVCLLKPERLNQRRDEFTWTVLEIMDHLRKVEEGFARGMASSSASPTKISMAEQVRALLLIGFMLLPTRVKVPVGAPVHPDTELDRAKVLSNWHEARASLLRTINDLRAERIRDGVIRHPVSGWMNVNAATWFLAAHIVHHRYQLRRVLR